MMCRPADEGVAHRSNGGCSYNGGNVTTKRPSIRVIHKDDSERGDTTYLINGIRPRLPVHMDKFADPPLRVHCQVTRRQLVATASERARSVGPDPMVASSMSVDPMTRCIEGFRTVGHTPRQASACCAKRPWPGTRRGCCGVGGGVGLGW